MSEMEDSSPTDVGLSVVANAWALRNAVALREKKFARLEMEREAAARKAAQSSRLIEERGREKARQKTTMQAYFMHSRNPENGEGLAVTESVSVNECSSIPESKGLDQIHVHEVPISMDTCLEAASKNTSPSVMILQATPGAVLISSDDSTAKDLLAVPDLQIPSESDESSRDDDFKNPPPSKRAKKNYNLTRKFQMEWSAKCPWAEMVLASDGVLHMVRCRVCSEMEKKPYQMGPKLFTLQTHEKRAKHKKNMVLYASKRPTTVLEQMNSNNSVESRKKRVRLATLFQVLSDGRPMAEFTCRLALYELLSVPDLPRMHWIDRAGWIMASHMWSIVQEKTKSMIGSAQFIALTADETSGVDNCSYIAVHCYVMENWTRVPMLILLQKLEADGASADNLTTVITSALSVKVGLSASAISARLICFGADGVAVFQGHRTGITKQIQSNHVPFVQGVHCMAHRCNLAFKTLSSLDIMSAIEDLLHVCHNYFSSSPKKFAEFHTLALMMETKGLKLLKNVSTRWVSLIDPLRRLLSEYRSVVAKMTANAHNSKETKRVRLKAKGVLAKLIDPYVLFGMTCLLPLLESIDHLVLFAQKRDVFICDFVAALQVCQGQLYKLYIDSERAFVTEDFWSFKQLLQCSDEQIHLKWVPLPMDLNAAGQTSQLAFVVGDETVNAMHEGHVVTRESFSQIVSAVKAECKVALAGGAKRPLVSLPPLVLH